MSKKYNTYTDEYKSNIVKLYNSGKSATMISKEYNLSTSTLYKWIKEFNTTGSFKAIDNRLDVDEELRLALKEIKQVFYCSSIFVEIVNFMLILHCL